MINQYSVCVVIVFKATDHNFYQDTRDSKPTKSIFYDPFDSLNTQNIDVKTKKRHLFHFDSN